LGGYISTNETGYKNHTNNRIGRFLSPDPVVIGPGSGNAESPISGGGGGGGQHAFGFSRGGGGSDHVSSSGRFGPGPQVEDPPPDEMNTISEGDPPRNLEELYDEVYYLDEIEPSKLKIEIRENAVAVDFRSMYTKDMSLEHPFEVATVALLQYYHKWGYKLDVSLFSLAHEIYAHVKLYDKGILKSHTVVADCGENDKERFVWDLGIF
jgi:hypothetical protein